MGYNLFLSLAQKVVEYCWQSREVKELVVTLLAKYSASTDNDVDDLVVNLVRTKLLESR